MNLKQKLINMIFNIQDESKIEYLYTFISMFLKEWP